MTYSIEDALETLGSYKGCMIEVCVARETEDGTREHFAGYSGVVDRIIHSRGPSEHWTVRFAHDPDRPHEGSLTIWLEGYEGADAEDGPERIVIRQRGMLIDVEAYV